VTAQISLSVAILHDLLKSVSDSYTVHIAIPISISLNFPPIYTSVVWEPELATTTHGGPAEY
jgi:hypothetical protein